MIRRAIPVMNGFFLSEAASPLDTDIPIEPLADLGCDLNEALKRRQPGGAGSSHGAH